MATRGNDRKKAEQAKKTKPPIAKPISKASPKKRAAQDLKASSKPNPKKSPKPKRPEVLSPRAAKGIAALTVGPAPEPPVGDKPTPGKLAKERRRLHAQDRRERQQRIRVFKEADKAIAQSRENALAAASAPGAPKAFAAAAATPPPLRILAEGDSWFDYPNFRGAGVIWQLENTIKLNALFLNLAKAGDEARYMLGVDERKVLADQLKQAVDRGRPFDGLLFSGGGNDIVGNPLVLWLKTFAAGMTADQVIDSPRFDAAAGLVLAAYEDLIQIRDAQSPDTAIFLHAYDHAIPDGRGICGIGPWLQPSLKARGVPEALRRDVVKALLSRFATKLQALASDPRKIFLVPTQGALLGHDGWWDNELHPNADGFRAVAKKFRDALRAVFPGRV